MRLRKRTDYKSAQAGSNGLPAAAARDYMQFSNYQTGNSG